MEERKVPTDAEIDVKLAETGITIADAMKPGIRDACRALKLLALKLAERNVS